MKEVSVVTDCHLQKKKPPPVLEHQGAAYIEGADCFAGALPFYFNRIGGKVNGEKVSRRKRHHS